MIDKRDLDHYLNELSKEYKRLGGRKMPIEIILVGGAAIIERYTFRESTVDVDALYPQVSLIKEAIDHVGDRFGLANGWLNSDFVYTMSYTHKIVEFSKFYRNFNQVLDVRIVTGEYLIAMKLRSARRYKHDLSDIVGILVEHHDSGVPIDKMMIDKAVCDLYGGWDDFSKYAIDFLNDILEDERYLSIYNEIKTRETKAKEALLDHQNRHQIIQDEKTASEILKQLEDQEKRS